MWYVSTSSNSLIAFAYNGWYSYANKEIYMQNETVRFHKCYKIRPPREQFYGCKEVFAIHIFVGDMSELNECHDKEDNEMNSNVVL